MHFLSPFFSQLLRPKAFLSVLLLMSLGILCLVLKQPIGPSPSSAAAGQFSGVHAVPPKTLKALFPKANHQPMLIEFESKYCLDCKALKKVLKTVMVRYPTLQWVTFDIQLDRKQYPAVFEAFQPTMVPILILVDKQARIQKVLYGAQSEKKLRTEIQTRLY